jgi:AraC-like DNA-binding protein
MTVKSAGDRGTIPPVPTTGPSVGPYERVLWSNAAMTLGSFDAPPDVDDFETAGQIGTRPALAFSRSAVGITHARRAPIVSDGTVAVLHNPGWPFRRFRVDARGDHCEWLSIDPEALLSVNPRLGRDPRTPFASSSVPLPRHAAALIRLVARHLRESDSPDQLFVEEALLEVISLLAPGDAAARTRGSVRHDRVVQRVRELLSSRPEEEWTVTAIAREAGASPFHVCRLFRRRTGWTLHAYLTEQRLREALTRMMDGDDADLRDLAVSLGFSSHSHFTDRFRRAFGVPPSRFRRKATGKAVRELAGRLQAFSSTASRSPSS